MIDAVDAAAFGSFCEPVPAADFIDLLQRVGLSAEAYRDAYGDLAATEWGAQHTLWHLFHHGLDERRLAPLTLDRQALVALSKLPMQRVAFKSKLLTFLSRNLFDNIDTPDGTAIAERWDIISDLVREGGCPFFITGDSHSSQYAVAGAKYDAWMLPIHLLCTGASAAGLANPDSRSGYGDLLQRTIRTIQGLPGSDEVPFLLQFGQVDLEFVYHYRRVRDARQPLDLDDYRAFCDRTLTRYIQFVSGLFAAPDRRRVFLLSVFPPALSDAAWHDGYVNADIAHREMTASVEELRSGIRGIEVANLRQRTAVHAYYNDILRAACDEYGFGYIDGMTSFLGVDGIIDPRFVIPETGGAEHHLDARQTYRAISKLIWYCIDTTKRRRPLARDS
jgi:hypothetical protein